MVCCGTASKQFFRWERIALFQNWFHCSAEAANFWLDNMFLNRIILFPFVLRQPSFLLCVSFLLLLTLTSMLTDIQGLAHLQVISKEWLLGFTESQLRQFRPLMVQFKFTLFVTNADRASLMFAWLLSSHHLPHAAAFEVMMLHGQSNQATNEADT